MSKPVMPDSQQLSQVGAFSLLLIFTVILIIGCEGCANSMTVAVPGGSKANLAIGPDNPGSVQLRIGDDPDTPDGRIVTLSLDIKSMRAWNSSTPNNAIDFLTDPINVELTHSSTITIPIAQAAAHPNTSYDRLDIVYSGLALSYVDCPSGSVYSQEFSFAPMPTTLTVDLASAPIQLLTDPQIINVKISVPSMVVLPPVGIGCGTMSRPVRANITARPMASGGSLGSNPSVKVSQSSIKNQQPENGQIQYLNGTVTNIDNIARTLTVKTTTNAHLTFHTGAGTRFQNITLDTAPNMLVEVTGSTQADGSLYADEVELVDTVDGHQMLGMVTYSDVGAEMSVVVHDVLGLGMTPSLIGQSVTSQLDVAGYAVNAGNVDMTGVTAGFDVSHLFPGQEVEIESKAGLRIDPYSGTYGVLPYMVELEQQTISGSSLNYVSATGEFDVVLPTNGSSQLVTLNPGLTSVHVFRQATTFPVINSIDNNRPVQVRGILLCANDNGGGQPCNSFVLVASKITLNN